VEAGNSWSRERLREAVGNLIKCVAVAVDKAECVVVNNLLTQPVITGIKVLHARRCDEGISHLLASFVVFEQRGGAALRKAKITAARMMRMRMQHDHNQTKPGTQLEQYLWQWSFGGD
jgi:hypothetical protein